MDPKASSSENPQSLTNPSHPPSTTIPPINPHYIKKRACWVDEFDRLDDSNLVHLSENELHSLSHSSGTLDMMGSFIVPLEQVVPIEISKVTLVEESGMARIMSTIEGGKMEEIIEKGHTKILCDEEKAEQKEWAPKAKTDAFASNPIKVPDDEFKYRLQDERTHSEEEEEVLPSTESLRMNETDEEISNYVYEKDAQLDPHLERIIQFRKQFVIPDHLVMGYEGPEIGDL
ncbi:hypothetical protein HAX54_028815 [Datura stramonium]|uniref:Uncharacterized protein n=1 Tax=Datura stramonium TaxID=4076 RepID=A0ABS8V6X6_DATST|nr:hypothetical protein [Datura stramonium]